MGSKNVIFAKKTPFCGFAATGTTEYNDELAQKRAVTIRDILVNDYGVDAGKIILNPLGSREQVYEKTSLNRIVRITVLPK